MNRNNRAPKVLFWYLFDAGNSAHALLVSSVGFALYFRQYLYPENSNADSLWGLITALVLTVSALISPFLTSWLYHRSKRWLGLVATTIACVFFTVLLGFDFSDRPESVVLVYVIGAIGYYLALPIYTSYIHDLGDDSNIDSRSGNGWAIGYLGGIAVALIAFATGTITASISENPESYRKIFVIAGAFNLICSFPLLFWAWKNDRDNPPAQSYPWQPSQIFDAFISKPEIFRLLFSYWMISETSTIAVYFTAIFLGQYAGLSAKMIFICTILVQLLAAVSTALFGKLSKQIGASKTFYIICFFWLFVPALLWCVKIGLRYWIPLSLMGLVLGAHHALVRAEIARFARLGDFTQRQKGSIFGVLEVFGRVASIFGPLIVGLAAIFVDLSEALLIASLFPIIALLSIRKYKWVVVS